MNIEKELKYIENYVNSEDVKPRSLARAEIEVEKHLDRILSSKRATDAQKLKALEYAKAISDRIDLAVQEVGVETYQNFYDELIEADKKLSDILARK